MNSMLLVFSIACSCGKRTAWNIIWIKLFINTVITCALYQVIIHSIQCLIVSKIKEFSYAKIKRFVLYSR